jgi:excisionase family DNA binding protein
MSITATLPRSFLATAGQDIDLFPVSSSELTVAQAAALLDVPEGYITELFDDSPIKYRKEGSRYLIDRDSLLEYKQTWERRHAAVVEMVQWDQEMGLYED